MITGGPDEAKMVYSQFENNINMITSCLHTFNVVINDDIINALFQEMRDDYNNNNNLTAFYNKYNFTAYNGSITDVDVSNNAFKELLSRFNVNIPIVTRNTSIHEKVSLKRAVPNNRIVHNKNYSKEHRNQMELSQMKNSSSYSNKIGLRNGTYYIQCSPVNDNDTGLKRVSKIRKFCMIAESMGLMKTKDASMIDDMFNREGVVLEFTAHNDNEVKYLFKKIQELANDYDDGNGFIVYDNKNHINGHDYVTTFNASVDYLRDTLDSNGLPSNIKCYEYKDEFNQKHTIIDSKNNSMAMINAIKKLTTIPFNDIKTNVYTIRRER